MKGNDGKIVEKLFSLRVPRDFESWIRIMAKMASFLRLLGKRISAQDSIKNCEIHFETVALSYDKITFFVPPSPSSNQLLFLLPTFGCTLQLIAALIIKIECQTLERCISVLNKISTLTETFTFSSLNQSHKPSFHL
jgi:hypothetical protein